MVSAAAVVAGCSAQPTDRSQGTTPAFRPACQASTFAAEAGVVSATAIAAGRYSPPGSGQTLDALPAFCRINGVATPTADSHIDFEAWVPEGSAWNGKLVATGNGGYNPALQYGDMAYALRQGYAAVGSDTGHPADGSSGLAWGAGHPERIVDWAGRSIHATLAPARRIAARLGARPVARSYFYGCSTGGRQGYAAVQRHPQDFDGVIAGAPANDWVALSTESLWRYRANRDAAPPHELILPAEKLPWLHNSAIAACDALDGRVDGVIDDPRQCTPARFDVGALACAGADADDCLTPPQVAAVERLYQGATNLRTGAAIYPGPVRGAELGWANAWREDAPARRGFWGGWVFADPAWDPWRFDFDRDVEVARERLGPLVDQVDADLSAFAARSGKLIVYQGWADPVISALDTIGYVERVRAAAGGRAGSDAYLRLFVVPGMGHCGGGPGATVFGNAGNAVPRPTPETDLLSALDRWVEQGVAPDRMTASQLDGDSVVATRTLCPHPQRPVADSGDRVREPVCR